ncbi:hypothetical protein GCM10009864_58760 [Streptomyces lunalinharesii]|uniref:Uncharacterized protein n=1 Tax=Streptomyces lunalinharesii TaxID=333384 RepID=A0ABP6F1R3_9ACTN
MEGSSKVPAPSRLQALRSPTLPQSSRRVRRRHEIRLEEAQFGRAGPRCVVREVGDRAQAAGWWLGRSSPSAAGYRAGGVRVTVRPTAVAVRAKRVASRTAAPPGSLLKYA